MAEAKDVLAEMVGRYLTGFALSKAIFEEVKEKQRIQTEEALNKS